MNFKSFGKDGGPVVLLIPGLGVSYEIFVPLIGLLADSYHVVAVEVDGFTLGVHTEFTSVDDQVGQVIKYKIVILAVSAVPTDFHLEARSCLEYRKGTR